MAGSAHGIYIYLSTRAELHLPHKSLLPFCRAFHNQSTPPSPAHSSSRCKRRKGDVERGGGQFHFPVADFKIVSKDLASHSLWQEVRAKLIGRHVSSSGLARG